MLTKPTVIHLQDYKQTPYAIDRLELTIRLERTKARIVNEMHISVRPSTKAGEPLVLDGDDLVFVKAELNGVALAASEYEVDANGFTLLQPPAGNFALCLVTEVDPSSNTQLMGLYRSGSCYCTQCEAEGFRRITYFYDRPDILSVYKVRLEAVKDEAPHLLANGNCIERGDLDTDEEGRLWHYAVWHDPFPKPSYLFACVAGDLARVEDHFVTMSGRKVALHIYVEHGKEDRVAYAFDALKRSMRWDEETYGREYDLDIFMIVAVSDFNMGAMENKGLNIFNDKYVLAKPDTATDSDYALIEAIIAHEYFHNWTGNRITCRDWFQLCLKEGLTVFRDQEFSSDMRSRPVKRIADVRQLRARQFPEDGGPLAHPVRPESYSEINNFYTATVYEKGAEICRMIETILGPDGFRAGMDLYFDRHDGEAATIEDFLLCFEDANGCDLSQFALWYSQAGTPDLAASSRYNARRKELSISIEQSCPATPGQPTKKTMHIPLRFGLVSETGEQVGYSRLTRLTKGKKTGKPIEGDVLAITEQCQEFLFEGVEKKAIPSLLRGFSAPVQLRSSLEASDHLTLMRHDSDAFNRWQSAQYLLMEGLISGMHASRRDDAISFDQNLLDGIAAIAENDALEPAFRAQILQFPNENDIAREIGKDVDPDAIHASRLALSSAFADSHGDLLDQLYHGLKDDGPYSPDAASAGRRALRNAVLHLLMSHTNGHGADYAEGHYRQAVNMTDRVAALGCVSYFGTSNADALLHNFHERYKDDALIVDKWMGLQATAPGGKTVGRIGELMQEPCFTLSNPNRVMALVGSFAMGNPVQFNREDGAGFSLVCDVILKLDRSNPQTAARLLNNFRSWRVLEPGRSAHAKRELERIAAQKSLSKDVADIVNRCLQ